jgi:hypothetical protein
VSTVGYGLRRPVARWDGDRKYAACPRCRTEVTETLGAPAIPTLRLANQDPHHVDGDTINVRGYTCDRCRYVLAIAPAAALVDICEADAHTQRVGERAYLVRFPDENGEVPSLLELVGTDGGDAR